MNDLIALRASSYRGKWAKTKRDCEAVIKKHIPPTKPPAGRYTIICKWYEWNTARDPDGISAGLKMINDALQDAGVIEDDGWANVESIIHRFRIAESQAGVGVRIQFWLDPKLKPLVVPKGRCRTIENRLVKPKGAKRKTAGGMFNGKGAKGA